jgi:two-component system chemotaxis sensor kinase CheA
MSRESEFLERLKETFKGEAEEHRAAILGGLLALEKGEPDKSRQDAVIEGVFREVHSLKGAARAVDIGAIEQLCQAIENIISALKKRYRKPEKTTFDMLYKALDLVAGYTSGQPPATNAELAAVLGFLKADHSMDEKAEPSAAPPEGQKPDLSPKAPISMPETVRISATKLGAIFLRAEEMLSVKQIVARHAADLGELFSMKGESAREWEKANQRIKPLKEMALGNAPLKSLLDYVERQGILLAAGLQKLEGMVSAAALESFHTRDRVDSLLMEIRTSLMLPFSLLLESFPRMVRDLAAEEGKDIQWEFRGEDAQIDKRVLEEIKDPLLHITRNSISHGIELPALRAARGKPPVGKVVLTVEQVYNDKIGLSMHDDGSGIDLGKVKAAAVSLGVLRESEAAAMDDRDALRLIFLSELSTSPMITDISGRGLGLAIAREKIEAVGGTISVSTQRGQGTTFSILIPMSLATYRGVLVESRGQTFAIPTTNVDQVIRVDESMVVSLESQRSVPIGGQAVSLVDLGDILGLKAGAAHAQAAASFPVVVLIASGVRIAFRVDDVLGEQEVLVKHLGRQLIRVRNVSGATILVSGMVVPILNASDLMKSAALSSLPSGEAEAPEAPAPRARRILVTDDSVTSRMLLKSMLESDGYQVKTAIDGIEALSFLKTEDFDLLVSDIDMPRMNGFALCRKVRGLPKTAELPIVLVTSLDSREDREKGIDAGASAYIAKSSFDRSNLLGVVKRLL